MRCKHQPRQLYRINRESLVAVMLAPHRALDWYVCDACGHVGLRSRFKSRKIHWRSYADPELVANAEKWNAWASGQR